MFKYLKSQILVVQLQKYLKGIFGSRLISVSYTHLDVYKRQFKDSFKNMPYLPVKV